MRNSCAANDGRHPQPGCGKPADEMDVAVIRWESLVLVIAMSVLAIWALTSTAEQSHAVRTEPHVLAVRVEVRRPGASPEVLTLPDGSLIGRSRECHIVIDDDTVSKQHARFSIEDGRAYVEDLHSTNGTAVNGKLIDYKTALRRGDRIGLGSNLIVLVGVTQPALNRQRQ